MGQKALLHLRPKVVAEAPANHFENLFRLSCIYNATHGMSVITYEIFIPGN